MSSIDDLKATIAQLESKLEHRDEQLASKSASFDEALAKESKRAQDRERRDAARRQELEREIDDLKAERSQMKGRLDALQDAEEDATRKDEELKKSRRELYEYRVKVQQERKELEEQLTEKRRAQERARQEVSDLRCHISVIEHRLQSTTTKLQANDEMTDENARLSGELRRANDKRDTAERNLKAEAARYGRDRKAADEKLEAALSELRELKSGPSRVDMVAKYESLLEELRDVALEACAAAHRPGGPTPPTEANDTPAMWKYIDAVNSLQQPASPARGANGAASAHQQQQQRAGANGAAAGAAEYGEAPTSARSRSAAGGTGSNAGAMSGANSKHRKSVDNQSLYEDAVDTSGLSDDAIGVMRDLCDGLSALVVEKQLALVRRFRDTVRANVQLKQDNGLAADKTMTYAATMRGFGVTSGFPSVRDPPAMLVNHISILTQSRDHYEAEALDLRERVQSLSSEVTTLKRDKEEKEGANSNNNTTTQNRTSPKDEPLAGTNEGTATNNDGSKTPPSPSPSRTRRAGQKTSNPPPTLLGNRRSQSIGGTA